jgi:hypothetical protein
LNEIIVNLNKVGFINFYINKNSIPALFKLITQLNYKSNSILFIEKLDQLCFGKFNFFFNLLSSQDLNNINYNNLNNSIKLFMIKKLFNNIGVLPSLLINKIK